MQTGWRLAGHTSPSHLEIGAHNGIPGCMSEGPLRDKVILLTGASQEQHWSHGFFTQVRW